MADIKFACPHCKQHITCDELWGGHQLQCPSCQGSLTVPTLAPAPAPAPAAATAPAGGAGSSHVFKPPGASAPKLALGQAHAAPAESGTPPAPKSIPIRNLAPPKPKKANPIFTILKVAGVVIVLGVGGYFGFTWLREFQNKSNAKDRAAESGRSGESQVGHIANLNAVLDATEPGHIGEVRGSHASGATTRPTGVGSEIPMADGQPSAGAAANNQLSAVIPPVYTLDVTQARIPQGRVNGIISGTNFVADIARVDPTPTAQILRFLQGQAASPDRQILVYLHLKAGEKLGGQTLTIASDGHGPQVAKSWKTNPRYAPTTRQFSTGYALKLELGQPTNDVIAGRIYLALPDTEQTVVAGIFNATVTQVDPSSFQAMPTAVPTAPRMSPSQQSAYDQRYGIKR